MHDSLGKALTAKQGHVTANSHALLGNHHRVGGLICDKKSHLAT